jgi:hypothetical protein
MPGPGRAKSRQKSKQKITRAEFSPAAPDPYLTDIDNAGPWTMIVNILCDVFNLPGTFVSYTREKGQKHSPFLDLTTRSGLKKIHTNFEAIYQRLNTAYEKNPDNEKLRGGIIVIYSKMCVDSLLRNKLFHKGLSCN